METAIVALLFIVVVLLCTLLNIIYKLSHVISQLGSRMDSYDVYPAIPYSGLKRQEQRLIAQNDEYAKKQRNMESSSEHEDTKTPNKHKSDAYKQAVREYFEAGAKSSNELAVFRAMIEANWLVRSGKKTIDEVEMREMHAHLNSHGRGAALYKEWLEKES